ncbi:NERD domain-containing protein [Parafrankia sp. BMG5.11]|uniref:NERD domain-containing protein n=1 Tax=Parafrankia sp. BMG5.11 TaxID=222540 RepID=UPI00103DD8AE|nr:NERD domain-containing protein [Parafrankia sp. BMG5.11]TCJ39458.1 NERD domain-containing protein [Parafrankia sp. BMG5.11]
MSVEKSRRSTKRSRRKDSKRAEDGARHRPPREEAVVLDDLRRLSQSPGFVHALATLTFQSNVITAVDDFTVDDFLKIYSPDRLIRNETNLLIGLMLSGAVDPTLQDPSVTTAYVDDAIALLEELHQAIIAQGHEVFFGALQAHRAGDEKANPLRSGVLLREGIFYGGESAFPFQYEALARERYAPDAAWLQKNMGFDIGEAADVLTAIRKIGSDKFQTHQRTLRQQGPTEWTWLPIFGFSIDEIINLVPLSRAKVEKIVEAFTITELDPELKISRVGSYNKAATHPLTRLKNGALLSFLEYGAMAALYENPFYWISKDKRYLGEHSQTRGHFAERFVELTFCKVFPTDFVYRNVVFKNDAGNAIGEADVILFYGYRAFIVQAKSKRLTLASWEGDDQAIAQDFQKAVQEAYDQAVDCATFLRDGVKAFVDDVEIDIAKHGNVREYFPICITSEHYRRLQIKVLQVSTSGRRKS